MQSSVFQRAVWAALACAVCCLAAPSVEAAPVLASSGPYTLTQANVDDETAVWRVVADRPFSPADRQAIQNVMVSLFRHDPAWLLANARQAHAVLPRLRRMDPAQRADLRAANLADIYCTPQKLHMTAEEAAGMQAVMAHSLPIVGVDAASGTVIIGRDLDAAVAASRFVAAKAHLPDHSAHFRADLANIARKPAVLGPVLRSDLTDMERNWAAFQLTWPHESPSYQAQMLGRVFPVLRQKNAAGQGETGLAIASLALPELQFADYPYALNPKLAAYKRASDARMSRFKIRMQEYGILSTERNMHDFARSMSGQGPDPQDTYNPLPLPTP